MQVNTDEITSTTAALYKRVIALLNKMTPLTFSDLFAEYLELNVEDDEHLQGIVDILFDKAIDGPNHCSMCADFAFNVCSNQLKKNQNKSQFRNFLLTKCQEEFEFLLEKNFEMLQAEKEAEIEAADSEMKQKDLQDSLNELLFNEKRRMLATMTFIGELYKRQMLTIKTMVYCIQCLLDKLTNDNSLECLCELLTTIGQQLERENVEDYKPVIELCYGQLKKEMAHRPARLRVKIRDLLKLRREIVPRDFAPYKARACRELPANTGATTVEDMPQLQPAIIGCPELQQSRSVLMQKLPASPVESPSKRSLAPAEQTASGDWSTPSASTSTSSLGASPGASCTNACATSTAVNPARRIISLGNDLRPFEAILEAGSVVETINKNLKAHNLLCEWNLTAFPSAISYAPPTQGESSIDEALIAKLIRESFVSVELSVPNSGEGITPNVVANFAQKCEEWHKSTKKAFHIALSSDNAKLSICTHAGNKTVLEIWQNTARTYLEQQILLAKTTTVELSDTSPELASYGNLEVLAKLISRQFSPAAVKVNVKENATKLEVIATEENLSSVRSWLFDQANRFCGRPYTIPHPLIAYLLGQPNHIGLVSQIERKCDCLILPARDCVDFTSTATASFQSEINLANGRVVKIVKIESDISRQNVDLLLKPVIEAPYFASTERRDSFRQDDNLAEADMTCLSRQDLVLSEHVLHAVFEDAASAAVSLRQAGSRFFQMCLEAVRLSGAKTMAIPVEALCRTNIFNGDVGRLQSSLADALRGLKSDVKIGLREIRLVTSGEHQSSGVLSSASVEESPVIPKVEIIPDSVVLSSSRPLDQPVLSLASGVKVSLVRDDIAKVDAEVLVSSTQEGTEDLSAGGASCKAIFAAGGPAFASRVKRCCADGLAVGEDCKAIRGAYGSLKCVFVVHVALPVCPQDDASAEETIKTKATACLRAASGSLSIAFPVIGAGGLYYSASVVAKGLMAAAFEWASSGKAKRLKDIRFVVYDQTSLQAFQDIFRHHSLPLSASLSNVPCMQPSEESVAVAAFKLGCIEVKLDLTKRDVRRQHLLLAYAQNDATFASEWLEMLVNALTGADSYHIESVVIPLQTGALEALTPAFLADLFFVACVKFEAMLPKHLRSLRPYLENAAASNAFVTRMTDLANASAKGEAESQGRGNLDSFNNATRRFFSSESEETSLRQLSELEGKLVKLGLNRKNAPCFKADLAEYSFAQSPGDYIIYGKADCILKAVGILNGIESPFTKDSVQDLRFDRFCKGFQQRLTFPNTGFCIASKPGTTTAATFLALIGDALTELPPSAYPIRLPKDVLWYLQMPDEAWHLFGITEAAALQYLAKVQNSSNFNARLAWFDFGASTVTVGNSVMPLVRKTDHIPVHWISSDDEVGLRLTALSSQSREYKDIRAILQRSNTSRRQVIQIQRIENRPLFKQYLIQKDKITRSCPNGHVVERDLFHGTSKEHLDGICIDGFDRSRAGQSAGAIFGAGSYFSTTFDYSSHRNYAREGHVLFCKVLVGESIQGYRGLAVLPYKPGLPGVKYDSAVNDLQNPSIFVIFADHNAYPTYLITLATQGFF